MRRAIGDEEFFTLIGNWVSEHRHRVVGTTGFSELAERYAPGVASAVLDTWLYQARLPPFRR